MLHWGRGPWCQEEECFQSHHSLQELGSLPLVPAGSGGCPCDLARKLPSPWGSSGLCSRLRFHGCGTFFRHRLKDVGVRSWD